MNHVEVFTVEFPSEIESTVNDYCIKQMLNPISISTMVVGRSIIVSVVVEPLGGAFE